MRYPKTDLAGQEFGNWQVDAFSHYDYKGNAYWFCHCQCGHAKPVIGDNLKNGRSRSCGCITGETTAARVAAREIINIEQKKERKRAREQKRAENAAAARVAAREIIKIEQQKERKRAREQKRAEMAAAKARAEAQARTLPQSKFLTPRQLQDLQDFMTGISGGIPL